MYGFLDFDLSIDSFVNQAIELIQDEDFMERVNGNGLNDKENVLFFLWNELGEKTKFKKIVINEFDYITFESDNRLFTLNLKESKVVKNHFDILLDYNFKPNRKFIDKQTSIASDLYEEGKSSIMFDYNSLMKWFKKRNYLKRS